jgi:hypothetical protein
VYWNKYYIWELIITLVMKTWNCLFNLSIFPSQENVYDSYHIRVLCSFQHAHINFVLKNWVCLFVLFIAAWAIFQLSGGHHYRWLGCKFRPILGAQGPRAGRDLYRATPTATRDLGLYGLIRKTGTHVPQWGSNPQLKDHQIFEPDALTTAPRRRLNWVCDSLN